MRVAPRAASAWPSEALTPRLATPTVIHLDNTTLAAPPSEHSSPAARLVRLKKRAEFEQVLGVGGKTIASRTARFVLHHVADADGVFPPAGGQLSTGSHDIAGRAVDVSPAKAGTVRAGAVIPKRWARRSVTRSLLKRQVFAAFERHLDHLPSGMWLVRLRSSFEKAQFPSAASEALRVAARGELDRLFSQAAKRGAKAPRRA